MAKQRKRGAAAAVSSSSSRAGSERINRYISRCGLCSRREADRWIVAGRVAVNGSVVTTPGVQIVSGDRVSVDGKPVQIKRESTYLLYHKPAGLICARSDPRGRPLIYDALDIAPNVQSVGRLDMDSEGVLLLTDDGSLAQRLTRPEYGVEREYRVRLTGHLELEEIERLQRGGIEIGDGEVSVPWRVVVDVETGGHSWITTTLSCGRWREIRRTLEAIGHQVRRLIRVRFGAVKLDSRLKRGGVRPLSSQERRGLLAAVKSA
ncbi:MAG: pseudouridine synthase [Mariprofundales bacterium]|nr:pseudouridine synthase [Mariprofundales bacterium]